MKETTPLVPFAVFLVICSLARLAYAVNATKCTNDDDAGSWATGAVSGSCICRKGRKGGFCGDPVDDVCDDNNINCQNNGKCEDVAGVELKADTFICKCNAGFYGQYCEHNKRCTSDYCKNGGTCTESNGDIPKCNCPDEYRGEKCEIRKTCTMRQCDNGGTCTDKEKCVCASGYTGEYCTDKVPPSCDKSKCNTNQTCGNDHSCKCKEKYFGDECQYYHEIRVEMDPPRFVKEGKAFTLVCSIKGVPKAQESKLVEITWWRSFEKGNELAKRQSKLSQVHARRSDEGDYFCITTVKASKKTEVSKKMTVTVQAGESTTSKQPKIANDDLAVVASDKETVTNGPQTQGQKSEEAVGGTGPNAAIVAVVICTVVVVICCVAIGAVVVIRVRKQRAKEKEAKDRKMKKGEKAESSKL